MNEPDLGNFLFKLDFRGISYVATTHKEFDPNNRQNLH